MISGAARSGTLYMAELFVRLGYRTGHETVFVARYRPEKWDGFDGESSCHLVNWLDELPADWPLLHVTRDPMPVISSLLNLESFTARDHGKLARRRPIDGRFNPGWEKDTTDLPLRAARYLVDHYQRTAAAKQPYMRVDQSYLPQALSEVVKHLTGDRISARHRAYALKLRTNYNSAVERMGKPAEVMPWSPTSVRDYLMGRHREETMRLLELYR